MKGFTTSQSDIRNRLLLDISQREQPIKVLKFPMVDESFLSLDTMKSARLFR